VFFNYPNNIKKAQKGWQLRASASLIRFDCCFRKLKLIFSIETVNYKL